MLWKILLKMETFELNREIPRDVHENMLDDRRFFSRNLRYSAGERPHGAGSFIV